MKCPKCQTENLRDAKFCRDCAMPIPKSNESYSPFTRTLETPAAGLSRGSLFAERYEIIEELGVGGMGRVYRVFDKQIEGEIALKLIRQEIASQKKVIDRFRNELKLAREISHRNVCRMYDLNEDKGVNYITMEYVPGEDSQELNKKI